jgi:hypothetical protein
MDREDILRLVKDSRFISGIYNYCDRWCERCIFTSRCLNYVISEEDEDKLITHDLNNKAFWDKLHKIFQQTKEIIIKLAEEKGIDLNSADMEDVSKEIESKRNKAENHALSQTAFEYTKMVNKWFETEYPIFKQKEENLNTMLKLGIGGTAPHVEANSINNAIEVIRWYQHQIYVKLMRALTQEDFAEEIESDATLQRDSDGSAKVALIGMDRSISAWGRLRECFEEKMDSILDILLHLGRLQRKTEQVFPNARNFRRPGFDDGNSPL